MIRCAFLEVHVEEEMFAEFGDEDDIEDVEDESFEQEGPLGEGLGEAEVEHKVEEEALVAETLLTGTQAAWQQWCSTTHLGRCESRRIWTLRIYSTERTWCPFPHDIVNLKGNSTFQAVLSGTSSWSVFQGLRRSVRPKTKLWTTIWSTFHSWKLMSLVLLERVWNTLSEYIWVAICNFASQKSYGQWTKTCQKCTFSTYLARTRKG